MPQSFDFFTLPPMNTSSPSSKDILDRYLRPVGLVKSLDSSTWTGAPAHWIRDDEHGFLAVKQVESLADGSGNLIVELPDRSLKTVHSDSVLPGNTSRYDRCEDISEMSELNEATVLNNLRQRYNSDLIYTYSGLFLVAINPYRGLPIYSSSVIDYYRGQRREDRPPHVYAVADSAYRALIETRCSQSILITGESGAGKTENTKRVIQYLATIAGGVISSIEPSKYLNKLDHDGKNFDLLNVECLSVENESSLEDKIILANPILEAFGNAQTIRNNNSSRFGKFVRIDFCPTTHSIIGASVEKFLLEKSRVTHRHCEERSFHIFYQILAGADDDLRSRLAISKSATVNSFGYLKISNSQVIGVDDKKEFESLVRAMTALGMDTTERESYFLIVAAIMHLGSLKFLPSSNGQQAEIDPLCLDSVAGVCETLAIPQDMFISALLSPVLRAGRSGEQVVQSRDVAQVINSVEALSRSLYDRLFTRLVNRINSTLSIRGPNASQSSQSRFIGVLDIAGFEIFERNSFEQLCINHTNERLQQFFNHHMFIVEQEAYKRETIEWNFIDFGLDLQPTINLIERLNPMGILAALDEECIVPRGTDISFCQKICSQWAPTKGSVSANQVKVEALSRASSGIAAKTSVPASPGISSKNPLSRASSGSGVDHKLMTVDGKKIVGGNFEALRFGGGFAVQHYAGRVEYHIEGWLEKNKDPVNENVVRILATSSVHTEVLEMWSDYSGTDEEVYQAGKGTKKGMFRTVAQKHRESLGLLMQQLHSTHPHFVRCIVPNVEKRPGVLCASLILDQLTCNGVLEGIRICRLGFPNRVNYNEFRRLYELLYVRSYFGKAKRVPRDGVEEVVLQLASKLDLNGFAIDLVPLDTDSKMATKQLLDHFGIKEGDQYVLGQTMVFFKAGVISRLDELRDHRLSHLLKAFQTAYRMRLARLKKTLLTRQVEAVRLLQRNTRLYVKLRQWSWWKLFEQVKPLLSVTRSEQKIQKLEADLAIEKQNVSNLIETTHKEIRILEESIESETLARQKVVRSLEETQARLTKTLELQLITSTQLQQVKEKREEVEIQLQESKEQLAKFIEDSHRSIADANKVVEEQLSQIDSLKITIEKMNTDFEEKNSSLTRQLNETIESKAFIDELNRKLHLELQLAEENFGKLSEEHLLILNEIESKKKITVEEHEALVHDLESKIKDLTQKIDFLNEEFISQKISFTSTLTNLEVEKSNIELNYQHQINDIKKEYDQCITSITASHNAIVHDLEEQVETIPSLRSAMEDLKIKYNEKLLKLESETKTLHQQEISDLLIGQQTKIEDITQGLKCEYEDKIQEQKMNYSGQMVELESKICDLKKVLEEKDLNLSKLRLDYENVLNINSLANDHIKRLEKEIESLKDERQSLLDQNVELKSNLSKASETSWSLKKAEEDLLKVNCRVENLQLAMEKIESQMELEKKCRLDADDQRRIAILERENTQSELNELISKHSILLDEHGRASSRIISLQNELETLQQESNGSIRRVESRLRDFQEEFKMREAALCAERNTLFEQLSIQKEAYLKIEESLSSAEMCKRLYESRIEDMKCQRESELKSFESRIRSSELLLCAARGELEEEKCRRRRVESDRSLLESQVQDLLNARKTISPTEPSYYQEIVSALERTAADIAEKDRIIGETKMMLAQYQRRISIDVSGYKSLLNEQEVGLCEALTEVLFPGNEPSIMPIGQSNDDVQGSKGDSVAPLNSMGKMDTVKAFEDCLNACDQSIYPFPNTTGIPEI